VTPISCTIIAQNERERIGRTIESVRGLVDEIVVVDSGSTDGTQALCVALGARVVQNPWPGFGPQKRFAEDAAAHDWILNLDADEWLSERLRAEIEALRAAPAMPAPAFRLRTVMVYPGCDRPAFAADYHNYVRLYDRRVCRFPESLVHDAVPAPPGTLQLRGPANHQSFRSFAHLVTKEVAYYELQAKELRKSRAWLTARLPFEFFLQFLKFYVIRRHVFGGVYGLKLSIVVAFMRWLRLLILLDGPPRERN
jgi:glycosyltransferase involved in cell wall biosynthesis